jgi:hypothetical protein
MEYQKRNVQIYVMYVVGLWAVLQRRSLAGICFSSIEHSSCMKLSLDGTSGCKRFNALTQLRNMVMCLLYVLEFRTFVIINN